MKVTVLTLLFLVNFMITSEFCFAQVSSGKVCKQLPASRSCPGTEGEVFRDPNNNCQFGSCDTDLVCDARPLLCEKQGVFVHRDPNNKCHYPSCDDAGKEHESEREDEP